MKQGLLLLTGLPVTIGHQHLIEFALNFEACEVLHIMINSRSFEPVLGEVRFNAIDERFGVRAVVHHCDLDDVPQNPSEHPDFWNYWKALIGEYTKQSEWDFVFASEFYGVQLAETLGAKFIPCNVHRDTVKVSATSVRDDPLTNFTNIMEEMQDYFRQTITIFGQDSVGKTTVARALATEMSGYFVPEWAREYLEIVGSEINLDKMNTIVEGQYALQKAASKLKNKPFIFQDTDLLTTLGYFRLWNFPTPINLVERAQECKSDVYIVMTDDIPYEADPLRYGVDKRDTTKQFWIDVLNEFGCDYYLVTETDKAKQLQEVKEIALQQFEKHVVDLKKFVRT